MSFSKAIYTGTGSRTVFEYGDISLLNNNEVAESSQLVVYVDNVVQTLDTDYTVDPDADTVTFISGAPANGTSVVIQRETKDDARYVTYTDNSIIDEDVLNRDSDQLFYLIQENIDGLEDAMVKEPGGTYWAGQGLEVRNAAPGTTNNSLATVGQINAAVAGSLVATIDNIQSWNYTGDGTTVNYNLTDAPAGLTSDEQVMVYVSGVRQNHNTDYNLNTSVTPKRIEFTTAPPSSANIYMLVVTGDVTIGTLADGIVTTAKIADDAVTEDKIRVSNTGVGGRFLVFAGSGQPAVRQIDHTDITDFDTGVQTNRLDQLGSPTNTVNFNGQRLSNLGTATNNDDAISKQQVESYVASQISGIGNTRIQSGVGTSASSGSTFTQTLSFAPDSVMVTAIAGGTEYGRVFSSSATIGGFTMTLSGSGFTLTGVDNSTAVHWIAVKDS